MKVKVFPNKEGSYDVGVFPHRKGAAVARMAQGVAKKDVRATVERLAQEMISSAVSGTPQEEL